MLTADLIKPRLREIPQGLSVRWVDVRHAAALQSAGEVLALFREHLGQPRKVWLKARERYEGDRLDYLVVRGLAKVLMDAATYTPIATPLPPAEMRALLFARGPGFPTADLFHPQTRGDIIADLAPALGLSGEQLEQAVFADRWDQHILKDCGPEWTPERLLMRYNLELARGVLYWASTVSIDVYDSFKDMWKFIKLFKLMATAFPLPDGGYHIELDGPLTPFVKTTTRYGRAFAAWMPSILLCKRWRLQAQVRSPLSNAFVPYVLDDSYELVSYFKSAGLYDSSLEKTFAEEFEALEAKFGSSRGRWRLEREREVLLLGDTVMIPDFLVTHESDPSRKILIELVGYWRPSYLRRKIEKVMAAQCQKLLLLVFEGLKVGPDDFAGASSQVLFFKSRPVVKDVLRAIEQMADRLYGPLPRPLHHTSSSRQPMDLAQVVSVYREKISERGLEWTPPAQMLALFKEIDPCFSLPGQKASTITALINAHPELFETRRLPGRGRPMQVRCRGKIEVSALVGSDPGQENE